MLPHDLGADIFKGQIITIAVVIVFLTIFLLREWIIQNARPGVFGDEDVPDAVVAVPDAAPAVVVQGPAAGAGAEDLPVLEALQAMDVPVEPELAMDLAARDDYGQVVDSELRQELPDSRDASTDEDDSDSVSVQSHQDTVSVSSNPEVESGKLDLTESRCVTRPGEAGTHRLLPVHTPLFRPEAAKAEQSTSSQPAECNSSTRDADTVVSIITRHLLCSIITF
jgi:hypothetical protein